MLIHNLLLSQLLCRVVYELVNLGHKRTPVVACVVEVQGAYFGKFSLNRCQCLAISSVLLAEGIYLPFPIFNILSSTIKSLYTYLYLQNQKDNI